MKRNYTVRWPIVGHEKGDKIGDDDLGAGVNADALVAGGFLRVTGVEPVACPACVEQGLKKPPKYESIEELRDHYADKHAGLEPPGEEELADG